MGILQFFIILQRQKSLLQVLLLEAGPEEPDVTMVPAFAPTLGRSNIDWNYRTQPEKLTCRAQRGQTCAWLRYDSEFLKPYDYPRIEQGRVIKINFRLIRGIKRYMPHSMHFIIENFIRLHESPAYVLCRQCDSIWDNY